MKKTAQAAATNWKSTVAGLIMIAFSGAQIYRNPSLLMDPEMGFKVAAGAGLIAAADGTKKK